MGKRTEDDTLRPDYDFSAGVRGKHYQAYRQGIDVSVRKSDEPSLGALATAQVNTQPLDLWSQSASRRLEAARSLTDSQLTSVQQMLCEGCPVDPWPYGNATSINPMLVTLGASPSSSPAVGDSMSPECWELPPAGSPHPQVHYEDTEQYLDKIRHLARIMLTPSGGTEEDAYALFGDMNLDGGRSGGTSRMDTRADFAEWLLRTIKCALRPRWLVCLGLAHQLKRDRTVRQMFESILEIDIREPHDKYPLLASKYHFREWTIRTENGPLTVVFWPGHPSRHPFMDFTKWRFACDQFKRRHAGEAEGG